jgi:cytidine deaminase
MTMPPDELLAAARAARAQAYVPYSHFPVGAAVRADDGRIFTGCNIENASYGLTICAERVALFSAVAAGARRIAAVAVVAGEGDPAMPCGACRQALAEFGPAMIVTLAGADPARPPLHTTLAALFPHPFILGPES